MQSTARFSDSYSTARDRFIKALEPAGFAHTSYKLQGVDDEGGPLKGPTGEDLTIDVGVRPGSPNSKARVITSGLHGVEGFFGSAVQLGLLHDRAWLEAAAGHTTVLVHALNPYGFAWKRRWNENNVDLNRSFFTAGETRPETLSDFHAFIDFLCPKSPPPRLDTFPIEAGWLIARHGFAKLKQTLPVGQYDYPCCIFYGGNGPSETQSILERHAGSWVGEAEEILLLDLHTALGPWGTYKLLLGEDQDCVELDEMRRRFGFDAVEDPSERHDAQQVFYAARGTLLPWFKTLFPGRTCYATLAEFGTYSNVRVLQSLRAEHRAHCHGDPLGKHAWTKDQLMEMFVPASAAWREQVIASAMKVCRQAIAA